MSEELKSCPFCGGEAQLMINELEDTQEGTVMCMTCYATSTTQKSDDWREAIKAWNTRADNTTIIEKLEGMKQKLWHSAYEPSTMEARTHAQAYNQALQDAIDLIKGTDNA